MAKKIFIFTLLFLITIPSALFGAESQELAADYIVRTQNEISADLAHLRKSIETALTDMKLSSSDVGNRIAELAILTEKSSEDMAAWGYTDEQRETYRRDYNYAIEEAAYDAGHRRMVPIFLTTATTAVGVIPM
ncbi:MAG: hypothetical protein IJP91_01215, partial [Synergistaceae bacterium]|nr:hypothetical protein [Synergistaceae bacterium]